MTVTHINAPLMQIQCPAFLRDIPGWLVWRLEQHEGEEKARKMPYYAGGGRRVGQQGTEGDRAKLVTFDAALAVAARRNFDGVGFAPMPEFSVTALDFDNVVGTAHQQAIEDMLLGTYAEFSPSGRGIRAFVRGTLPNRKSHAGDRWPYTFETFGSKGFVTFTGMPLPQNELFGGDVDHPSGSVRRLYAERFAEREAETRTHTEEIVGFTEDQLRQMLAAISPEDYGTWIEVGMALHHETRGEGYELFDEWSQSASTYRGRDETSAKWNSFGKRSEGRSLTGRLLIRLAGQGGVSVGGPVASVDDFEVVTDEAAGEEKTPPRSRFEVVPIGEFSRRPPPRWIIKGILPEADLVVVFGESGSGKSFVVTDMAMAVARGQEWCGKAVRQGRVVYIAAEGGGGYRNRARAYADYFGVDLDRIPFGIIHATPNFLLKDDAKAVAAAIEAAEGADLIVVDTFAQVTPGANENAAEDMGLALKHARLIGDRTGATVVLVHHSGKDASKGARGWSGLRAAADAELEVLRMGDNRWIRSTKQKDGDDQGQWGFRLHKVTIGEDEDGEPIDSCVVLEAGVPQGAPGRKGKTPRIGKWEQAVLDAYAELKMGGEMVSKPDLIARAVELRPDVESAPRTKNFNAGRALETLRHALRVVDGFVFEVED